MKKINEVTKNNILKKTPWGHSSNPAEEGLNEEQIKGLFYRAITDSDNSVISEINRIVEEANRQFSEIDNTEYFGKLEAVKVLNKKQSWIRNGNLVYVYGNVPSVSIIEYSSIQNAFINVETGKNLFVKITAPEGIIPDSSLCLEIGDNTYTGLGLLRNSLEESLQGNYYIKVAIPANNVRKQEVKLRWNSQVKTETIVFDFNDEYMENWPKKVFIKFASSATGENASFTWNSDLNYVGFYYGATDTSASSYKWARFIPPVVKWSKHQTTINSWGNNLQVHINIPEVKADSIVIVSPDSDSYNLWHTHKIQCTAQANNEITISCATLPASAVTLNVVVGTEEE